MANRKVEWIGPMEQGEKRKGGEVGRRGREERERKSTKFLCVYCYPTPNVIVEY